MGFSIPSLPPTAVTEAAIAFGADMVSKFIVSTALPLHAKLNFFPDSKGVGWLIIRHEENCKGGGGIARWPMLVYLIILGLSFAVAARGRLGGGFIVGGSLGNIASFFLGAAATIAPTASAFLLLPPTGCVVDFVQVGAPMFGETLGVGAPVGNVADLFVVTGALMLSFEIFRGRAVIAAACAPFALVVVGVVLHSIRRVFTGA